MFSVTSALGSPRYASPIFGDRCARAEARAAAIDTALLAAEGLLPTPTEHYLSGTYPPLKAMAPAEEADVLRNVTDRLNLYVHIPFCRQRCTFCHFAKEVRATNERVTTYLGALCTEIDMMSDRLGTRQVASVYVGGGTPSTLAPAELTRLFAALHDKFPWASNTEVTFELHPQAVRNRALLAEQLRVLRASGVNRIAFGIQSLDDRVLRTLNRGHTAAEAFELIRLLHLSDFADVSVDLMYGLPYETLETWFETLTAIVERGVSKLNIFPLFLKVTDPISRLYARKPDVFPDGQERLIRHFFTDEYLNEEGFHSGPVLYYSRTKRHSLQQELKFDDSDGTNLLGLGVSSFGYLGATQYYNLCDVDQYLASLAADRLPLWRAATLSVEELARRTVMFALRSAGVPRAAFRKRFGQPPEQIMPQLRRFAELGLLTCADGVWRTTAMGAYCVDGMSSKLASDDVRYRVELANDLIENPRKSLLEQHDYSPLGRTGTHVVSPLEFAKRL